MEIYCTRLHCEQPVNTFVDLDNSKFLDNAYQKHCGCCGMPLILEGRYLPLELLQRDELSTIFLGTDLHSSTLKRCKIEQIQLNPSFTPSQAEIATKIFDREVKILSKLGGHPKIPRLIDSLEIVAPAAPDRPSQKFFYLVQEYIEGKNLATELLQQGQFTETEVIFVLREVVSILEFAHFQGSIHRNIRPEKILRDALGKIYLVDFGVAKQLNLETIDITDNLLPRKSPAGFKPEYTLPNQYLTPEVYPSSDLYSLAVTCVNLLTGRSPNDLLNAETNTWQWRTPDLQVSDYLAEILDHMLQELPIHRFAAARDVLDALDASLGAPILSMPPTVVLTANTTTDSALLVDTPYDDPFQIDDSFLQFEDDSFLDLDRDLFEVDERLLVTNKLPAPATPGSIEIVSKFTRQPKRKWPIAAMIAAGTMAAIGLIIPALWRLFESKPTMSDTLTQDVQVEMSRRSSMGERILVGLEGNRDTDKFKELKRAGIAAIASRNYPEAISKLQAALVENSNSPETRIYLNNALIGDQKSYTIAVVAPIERSLDRAAEMLRGFAQAQAEINQVGDITEAKIKLRIVDDSDDPRIVESIATAIGDRSELLGVVGHSRNDVAMKAAKVYNRKQIAFIAPISTSINLTGANKPYIFRTNNKGDLIAQQLVDHLVNNSHCLRVAIVYAPSVASSNEFKNQFTTKLKAKGGEVVEVFQFSTASSLPETATSTNFNPEAVMQKVSRRGADAIVLLPIGRTNREALKLLKVKATKYPKFDVIGDTGLYNFNTLKAGAETAGLVLNVPWQESESTTQFSSGAKQLWNTQVNWATATSYNAVKALGSAIKIQTSPSRAGVMQMLAKNEFMGAAGRFRFKNGDPTGRNVLVKVAKTPANYKYSSRTGYDFIPLD